MKAWRYSSMSFVLRHQMKVIGQLHATATLALGKVKVKAKFTLAQAVKAQRGVEIVLLFL
jgi:hypothetical protein